ncbi:MAG: hypothetical protein GXP17_09185 [Gammaproteobacteria bacterium]|nr:hypothetical protein [Gammaproteobacteria bacterium]
MSEKRQEGSGNSALPSNPAAAEQNGEVADRKSRRKFLVNAAVTTPVVLSVVSQSALGAACTVSGFLSGNLSNPQQQDFCGGRGRSYWQSQFSDRTTKYADVFGGVWGTGRRPWGAGITLYKVLNIRAGADLYHFGANSVAAYLNAMDPGVAYSMSPDEVVDIVNQVLTLGQYTHPGTGRVLDPQEVVDFFFGTFDM